MTQRCLPAVRKIAVFRPSAVGDFVFALPALHALRRAYPEADLAYLGRPWHARFLQDREGPIDRTIVVPPHWEVPLQGGTGANWRDHDAFVATMRGEQFDLALQLFGGGRHANPLMACFGARLTVGMRAPDAMRLDRWLPYGGVVNRRLQLLEVASLAGASEWPMQSGLEVTKADRRAGLELVPSHPDRALVVVQPGASDQRRCWAPERFAAVADELVGAGALVVVNGSADERELVQHVIGLMRYPAIDLAGKAELGALCGILERAALCVGNDTGPLHLALAIGTPAVGIYWFTNLIESAPLQQAFHRSAVSLRVHCPICGAENIVERCAHNASFVDDVRLDEVLALAFELYRPVRT